MRERRSRITHSPSKTGVNALKCSIQATGATMESDRKSRLARTNHWDEILALRDRQREQARNGIQVIKQSDLPLEVSRQGLMRWYMHPAIKDTVLSVLLFF